MARFTLSESDIDTMISVVVRVVRDECKDRGYVLKRWHVDELIPEIIRATTKQMLTLGARYDLPDSTKH